ncbi:phage tail protein [Umezawaea sp. Da 62-37]|uniref:phage tail protein n=1 Tax=Umezawaea sp. Da 62-37 TaxID=3075927 RepID=UPI0028F720E9|nr:phage tail protein [Umezawaea sp. Da 62-37]WNV87980.1 phage tail protein [Umezawaea sp. Da 62-37]
MLQQFTPDTKTGSGTGPSMGMAMRFQVVVDEVINLGGWRSCKGLSVEFDVDWVGMVGGHYDYQRPLPTQLKYGAIKLERVVTAKDSPRVQAWLRDMVDVWMNGDGSYTGSQVDIALYDPSAAKVAEWTLVNAYPKSWRGPDLDAKSGDFAIEALELIHEGFL